MKFFPDSITSGLSSFFSGFKKLILRMHPQASEDHSFLPLGSSSTEQLTKLAVGSKLSRIKLSMYFRMKKAS